MADLDDLKGSLDSGGEKLSDIRDSLRTALAKLDSDHRKTKAPGGGDKPKDGLFLNKLTDQFGRHFPQLGHALDKVTRSFHTARGLGDLLTPGEQEDQGEPGQQSNERMRAPRKSKVEEYVERYFNRAGTKDSLSSSVTNIGSKAAGRAAGGAAEAAGAGGTAEAAGAGAAGEGVAGLLGLESLAGPIGLVAAGATAATVALAALPPAVAKFADSLLESQRKNADASQRMNAVFGMKDFQDFQRKGRIGEATAGTAGGLNDALQRLSTSLEPMVVGLTNGMNRVTTFITNGIARVVEFFQPLFEVLTNIGDMLSEWLGIEQQKKPKDEPFGFVGLFEEIKNGMMLQRPVTRRPPQGAFPK